MEGAEGAETLHEAVRLQIDWEMRTENVVENQKSKMKSLLQSGIQNENWLGTAKVPCQELDCLGTAKVQKQARTTFLFECS